MTPAYADVDLISRMNFPAAFLQSGLNVNALRTHALLRKQEWELLDERLVEIATQTLVIAADLRALGLTVDLGGLGVVMSQYEQVGDMDPAHVTMSAVAEAENDIVDFTLINVPVPIIHKGFTLNIRHLEASRRTGTGIDVTNAETAARKVAEGVENLIFNGSSMVAAGAAIYGLLTHPNRNVVATAQDWGTATNIHASVVAMIGVAIADNMRGPYYLYVSPTQWAQALVLDSEAGGVTRLSQVQNTPGIAAVRMASMLPDGTAVLVQMTRDVIDLAVGQDITNLEWQALGPLATTFKVLTAAVPRVKADAGLRSGIVVHTGV